MSIAAHATSIAQALLLLSNPRAGFTSMEFCGEDAAPSPFSDGGIFSESLASSQSILNLVTRGWDPRMFLCSWKFHNIHEREILMSTAPITRHMAILLILWYKTVERKGNSGWNAILYMQQATIRKLANIPCQTEVHLEGFPAVLDLYRNYWHSIPHARTLALCSHTWGAPLSLLPHLPLESWSHQEGRPVRKDITWVCNKVDEKSL